MPAADIVIKGAREHNLQSVDVVLPRNQLICLTGVSGSGKSSLAFDTLYAEGQRRYIESLSGLAKHFLGQMPKPDVDLIEGISPSISISQKSSGTNPRSTVGTITEINDYLRILFARVGQGYCPRCDQPVASQSREQIITRIEGLPSGQRFMVLAPIIRGQKGEYRDLFVDLLKQGFVRARVDGRVISLGDPPPLDRQMRHHIEVVVDRLIAGRERGRLAEAVETALKVGKGTLVIAASPVDGTIAKSRKPKRAATDEQYDDMLLSVDYACGQCGISFEPPSPQLFSFNSPQGMCLACDGLGNVFSFVTERMIPDPTLSVYSGCFETMGKWKQLGRWRRHIFQGVADTIEKRRGIEDGTLLKSPWNRLPKKLQDLWLWGTDDEHITFTWRGGKSPVKYGGKFEGVVPELLNKYRNAKNRIVLNKLEKYMDTMQCPDCHGQRLNEQACSVRLKTMSKDKRLGSDPHRSLPDVSSLSIEEAAEFFSDLELNATSRLVATDALKEIRARLGFLLNVGLDYLSMDRTAPTLSGGESQRIRLAGQIGAGLVGVTYILDEPSIGLHPRDNDRLLSTLQQLRDMGNTVVVVEHDEDTMRAADHLIDFGPGPGVKGGEVVAAGPLDAILREERSQTGRFLSGREQIAIPTRRREANSHRLVVRGATHNNLKKVDIEFPLGCFVCVTGVSGSGKSSLINDILVEALRRDLNGGEGNPGAHVAIEGLEHLDKMIAIDQSPIGRTPRSNPGTYIKVFDEIRALFALLPDSKRRGFKPGRFSFNVKNGRCEACEGNGANRLEMDFLADIWVPCTICEGKRFNRETLQIKFKGQSIADVLKMDIPTAMELFENIPKIYAKLKTLHDVGLDYLQIGQPSPTLSGGEAQRIKLARELVKRSTGSTMYLLDEPTTGLHFADIRMLLDVLHGFVEAGNTVVVVEHNLDVIKTADWVIDLGPEGGERGGYLVASGVPEDVVKCRRSHTGKVLRHSLKPRAKGRNDRQPAVGTKRRKQARGEKEIRVRAASQHNLKMVSTSLRRDAMTVFCGPSGSGKTSLAMDTIYAEGQRRYVESLSSYARQFVSQMEKPRVEGIEGLSPAVAIEQKNLSKSPRSTVGTATEIYDYMRILMARLGKMYCPDCELAVGTQTADQIVDKVMNHDQGTRLYLMAPMELEVGRKYDDLWTEIREQGYVRVRIDDQTHTMDNVPDLDRRTRHKVEVIVDRVVIRDRNRSRIADSAEHALALGRGVMRVAYPQDDVRESRWKVKSHSQHLVCERCERSFDPVTPHSFSFNSPLGWCPSCEGLGLQSGANPASLIRDGSLTLGEGALLIWPGLDEPTSRKMLDALFRDLGVPTDVPIDGLNARQRRILFHGGGQQWVEVKDDDGAVRFRFLYKGLYPALEEASRLSTSLRGRIQDLIDEVDCGQCGGSRLTDVASAVEFCQSTIDQYGRMPLGKLASVVSDWKLDTRQSKIAGELVREIQNRIRFLNDVGLEYLSLSRPAASLSNGEAQRIRLASQLGSGLCGVLYVLDEPTIGLHPRDNRRLLRALHGLRDLGNTLLVVEHDREIISGADQICDFGPGSGSEGGTIVAQGTPAAIGRSRRSVTGPYLVGKKAIPIPSNRRIICDTDAPGPAYYTFSDQTEISWLGIRGARQHNLKSIDVDIPLGALTGITGPSGSGKSSLINDILFAALAKQLHRAQTTVGAHDSIQGVEHVNKVIRVDQQPLGNTPSSSAATYTGVFDHIRNLFAQLPDSRIRGYTARRFSFNVPGGRCDVCEGQGKTCIEMHFLPDVWVTCEECGGHRYNPETLNVQYHGHSINDVLNLTCEQALRLFHNITKVRHILQTLVDVGLGYISLGQSAPTLSGGEAQRVKLAAELSRPDTGRTLYLLDEPTTGLHFDDLKKLINVIQRLVDVGNSVVVIEHNLDVIKVCDWLIEMGPEAGEAGGTVVAVGTPEDLVGLAQSNGRTIHTAPYLAEVLTSGPYKEREEFDPEKAFEQLSGDIEIADLGKRADMPWQLDGRRWHTKDRVDRKSRQCNWDGSILEHVVDQIEAAKQFGVTNWNDRTIVEITGPIKSRGWFLHAITGESWVLKLKFRVSQDEFEQDELNRGFGLLPYNDVDEIQMYGNEPRVKVRRASPWDEVQMTLHSWGELSRDAFDAFLQQAIRSFQAKVGELEDGTSELMPWKSLGRRWHFMRKGFSKGRVRWRMETLELLFEMLEQVDLEGVFQWDSKQLVNRFIGGKKPAWVTVQTKKPNAIRLHLRGEPGKFPMGAVMGLGSREEVEQRKAWDVVRIDLRNREQLKDARFQDFLRQHYSAFREYCQP
ncbi:MAG: excinuclease ABC subunit UvrA [Pirellulaceae bacterium]